MNPDKKKSILIALERVTSEGVQIIILRCKLLVFMALYG